MTPEILYNMRVIKNVCERGKEVLASIKKKGPEKHKVGMSEQQAMKKRGDGVPSGPENPQRSEQAGEINIAQ